MERRFPLSTNVERGLGGEANVRGGQGVRSRSEVEREPPAFGLQPPAITQQEEGLPLAVQLRETALPPGGELRQALLELCLESGVDELIQLAQVRSVCGVHLTLRALPFGRCPSPRVRWRRPHPSPMSARRGRRVNPHPSSPLSTPWRGGQGVRTTPCREGAGSRERSTISPSCSLLRSLTRSRCVDPSRRGARAPSPRSGAGRTVS